MPRLMSVSMTKDAVIERRKTVTRRRGWAWLTPGTRLTLVEKAMGLKKGEKVVRLAEVEVVNVRREPLLELLIYSDYGHGEVAREGFPGMDPGEFVQEFFLDAQDMTIHDVVTRIEWRYLDGEGWVDRQGDVWTLGGDGLMHTPETAPFPREHVEKKWGPLRPVKGADRG